MVLLSLIVVAAAASAQSSRLDNAEVIRMVEAGLGPAVVSEAISSASDAAFDTSAEGLIALKTAGVPDAVISAMIKRASRAASPRGTREPRPAAGDAQVRVADGTPLSLRLAGGVSSATAKTGDALRFTVADDIRVDGLVVIVKGAAATGRITGARKAGSFGRAGSLNFEIDSVEAADGTPVKLRFSRLLKGNGSAAGAIDMATSAASRKPSRVLDSAKGQLTEKGADITVRGGTQYEVFTDGVHQVAGSADTSRSRRK
jgi:hypothetical protein